MMRIDYRWLRLVSVPAVRASRIGLLVLVFVPQFNASSAARRAGSRSARCRPSIRPSSPSSRWSSTSPTGSPGAAAGCASSGGARVPFLVILVPGRRARPHEPDLGHERGHRAHGVHDVLRGRREPPPPRRASAAAAVSGGGVRSCSDGYQLDADPGLLDPWTDPLGIGFHTIQGLLALGLGGILGAGLGESRLAGGLFLPNACNDFIFAIIGEEFGLHRRRHRDPPVRRPRLPGRPDGAGARRTRSAPCWRPGSPPGSASRRSSTSAVVVAPGPDHRHHAAVHQRRRVVADHQLRRRRHPPVDLARDGRTRNMERCGC